ncbi:MAG: nucleotide exchange factor GrpE [Firmicutes bacterium]|nr:nucleotide exchange factor GrpE [Bacillota bacterium]
MLNKEKQFENEDLQEQKDITEEATGEASEQNDDKEASDDGASQEKDTEILKQLEEKTKQCEEYFNSLHRTMAEFDNFRKRTIKEKERIYSDAISDAVTELLVVVDNLERAVEACKESAEPTQLLEGVELVLKQFRDSFCKLGVEEIKAVGEAFDPELHNAVMHIQDESVDENTIVEEFQKGYKINDKVIRHSMVKVAN